VYEGSQFQLLVFVWCSLLKTLHIGVTHVKCIARITKIRQQSLTMRTFKLEQSIKEIDMQTLKIEKSDKMITSHAGLALVGRAIHGYTSLTKGVDALFKQKSGTPMSDVIKSYIGILAQGKHSYVTVENVSGDRFFKEAMGLKKGTPSEVTLRTRLKKEAVKKRCLF